MFDKIVIKARINIDDIDTIVLRNSLEQCTEGDEVFYKSTAYANFSGCFIEIRGDTLRCKCSIHKLYSKGKTGKLDNSRPMTFAIAVRTMKELLLMLSVNPENAIVSYYEIGITMKLSNPANEYISLVQEASGRILWNDANFPAMRQKTTEKSKYYRKVMKIYDKSFEASEKGRDVGNNILRIETVYKRQSVPITELMDNFFLTKIGRIFYTDWSGLKFTRELSATKGVKLSQLDKAREINRIGLAKYKAHYRQMYLDGKLTKKQWETIRSFATAWPKEREKYIEELSPQEKEFKDRLLAGFQIGIVTPVKRNK